MNPLRRPPPLTMTLLASVVLGLAPLLSAHAADVARDADVAREAEALRKTVVLSNGITMGYIELGEPTKPPLVFLHGITNSSLGYIPLGKLLARDFRVFMLDLRGHGASDKPECCYSRVDFAYDVRLFLDRLGIARADIAGHSLGSMVAHTFAAYWPERTHKLALIASTLGPRSPASPDAARPVPLLGAWDAEIRKLQDPIDPDSPFMRSWWAVEGLDPAVQSMMRRESARIPANVWRAMLDQGQSSRDLRATVDWIRAPTLLVFGGKDALFGPAERDELIAWMPKAKVALYPDLGHSLPEESPAVVAAGLREFLLN
jgi:pimeloyl-ACP methyl ester carboxylesterase